MSKVELLLINIHFKVSIFIFYVNVFHVVVDALLLLFTLFPTFVKNIVLQEPINWIFPGLAINFFKHIFICLEIYLFILILFLSDLSIIVAQFFSRLLFNEQVFGVWIFILSSFLFELVLQSLLLLSFGFRNTSLFRKQVLIIILIAIEIRLLLQLFHVFDDVFSQNIFICDLFSLLFGSIICLLLKVFVFEVFTLRFCEQTHVFILNSVDKVFELGFSSFGKHIGVWVFTTVITLFILLAIIVPLRLILTILFLQSLFFSSPCVVIVLPGKLRVDVETASVSIVIWKLYLKCLLHFFNLVDKI